MQLQYERTIERLNLIHRRKAKRSLGIRVVLSRVGDGSSVDREFSVGEDHQPLFDLQPVRPRRTAGTDRLRRLCLAAECRLHSMVRPVHHGDRHRRSLLHGRRCRASDRRRKQEPPARDLQSPRLPEASRVGAVATGCGSCRTQLPEFPGRGFVDTTGSPDARSPAPVGYPRQSVSRSARKIDVVGVQTAAMALVHRRVAASRCPAKAGAVEQRRSAAIGGEPMPDRCQGAGHAGKLPPRALRSPARCR